MSAAASISIVALRPSFLPPRTPRMKQIIRDLLLRPPPPAWVRYGLTLAMVGLFALLRLALSDTMAGRSFLILMPPVLLAALFLDFRSAVLAAFLSTGAALWLWIDPRGSFMPDDPDDLLAATLFFSIGLTIAWLAEALRRAFRTAAASARDHALLLREVNHRVRNDLQTVVTMLHLAGSGGDLRGDVVAVSRRIEVLARVYDRLTLRDDAAVLDARAFLEGLVGDLRAILFVGRPVVVTLHADPVELEAGLASTVGLAVNELVTNAWKYAFPDGRRGHVGITLRQGPETLVLTVRDDGCGCDPDAAPRGTGIGQALLEQLAAQNGGRVERAVDAGVTVTVTFPRAAA